MMTKGFSKFMPNRTAFFLGLGIALLVAPVFGRGGKAIESNPERDKALAEADKKAFEQRVAEEQIREQHSIAQTHWSSKSAMQ